MWNNTTDTMKRLIFTACLMFIMLATSQAAKVARYQGSRIFWDSKSPVTVFQGGGYARMIQLQDGRLMACCESGGIKVTFSSNMGKTWTAPRVIAPNKDRLPNCVPDLIQLSDGTIIVAYNPRPLEPYTQDRRFGIRLRRSTDKGKTWSDEIFVFDADCTFENGCWEPSLLELPTGELQLYFADESPYTKNADQQISVTRSWDGGLTWSRPDCVSYRQGSRDGMPVPILLQDGKTIVVAIEDNGTGDGGFVPCTVRNSVTANWRVFVNGSSSNRQKAVNYTYCPKAIGGAPYLRQLPNGETVLSHQSSYGRTSKSDMFVYVGNNKASSFKAMSSPFVVPENQDALWNSLAVVDTGIVVAVAGYGGNIHMVKGYPRTQVEVPFATPTVDAVFSKSDGYFTDDGKQVMMGSETGTFSYADFAYDDNCLYLSCQVYDQTKVMTGSNSDCLSFAVETAAASHNVPQATSFRFDIIPDGTLSAFVGDGKKWQERQATSATFRVSRNTSRYVLELAIPWSDLGVETVEEGASMTFNLEVADGNGTTRKVERIPDAKMDQPATWMWLCLHENPEATAISKVRKEVKVREGLYDLSGRRLSAVPQGVYIEGGTKKVRE